MSQATAAPAHSGENFPESTTPGASSVKEKLESSNGIAAA